SAGSEAATTEAAPGDMGEPSQMDRAAAVAAAARVAIPEEEESELGMNIRCYTPAGSEIPCIDDHEPCGGDGSGRGPEDFDSTMQKARTFLRKCWAARRAMVGNASACHIS
ncbi:MAG: hypothetical protein ACPIOQ_51645, partial [Promethearchaeia archaeon]